MNSTSTSPSVSQPESIDLAYDMWAGQFEFVGNSTTSEPNNNQRNLKNIRKRTLYNTNSQNSNSVLDSEKNSSLNSSSESLEDLNLDQPQIYANGNYSFGLSNGLSSTTDSNILSDFHSSRQPILIDQEPFLSLNPADFDDIVSSGPNSLIFIDNKLSAEQINNNNSNNNNIYETNNNSNKIFNLDDISNKYNNKTNNTNTNGFKLENLKNFKNKLICDFEEKIVANNNNNNNSNSNHNNTTAPTPNIENQSIEHSYNNGYSKMNVLSAEICENLNEQLELIQRQVTEIADTKIIAEDQTIRAKTENAVLQARYHMLEEQYREAELRAEERLAEEQKRYKELLARVEREAELQNENCQFKIKTIELEANSLREETQRLKALCDKQANDLHNTQENLELARDQIAVLQQDLDEAKRKERLYEQEKKSTEELMLELSKELERLRAETGPAMPTTSPEAIRLEELHQELEEIRKKNRVLEEQNEDLQAQVLTRGVEEGRQLLNGTLNSLAQELEEMSQAQDSVDSSTLASLSQLQQAYQEKEEENARLKKYIDTIILNIVENYPQLLEIKSCDN